MPLRLGGMDGFRGELTQELYEHGPLVSVFRDVVQVQGRCRELARLLSCSDHHSRRAIHHALSLSGIDVM